MVQYFLNIFIAIDHLANAILLGNPDETISARLGREYPNSFLCKVVDFIFRRGHCKDVAKNGDGGIELITKEKK